MLTPDLSPNKPLTLISRINRLISPKCPLISRTFDTSSHRIPAPSCFQVLATLPASPASLKKRQLDQEKLPGAIHALGRTCLFQGVRSARLVFFEDSGGFARMKRLGWILVLLMAASPAWAARKVN